MHGEVTVARRPRSGSLGRAIIAGFVALGISTVALVVASGVAGALGEAYRDQGLLFQWMYELTHNPVVELGRQSVFASLALHLFFGIILSIIYAQFFEPRLRQYPGWLAGALFSIGPWLLSIFVFLPASGGGLLGTELRAGPLPLIGNLVLHLLYGAVLGAGYAADRYEPMDDTEDVEVDAALQRAAMGRSESDAARGILIGVIFGGILGAVLGRVLPFSSGEALVGNWAFALGVAGALVGGAVGALIGSMTGLTAPEAEAVEGLPSMGQPISAALLPIGVIMVVAGLIVTIGSALLLVSGDISRSHEPPIWGVLNPYYTPAIVLGLAILTVILGGAAALDKWLPRSEDEHTSHSPPAHH
jgi:hypothetical protein